MKIRKTPSGDVVRVSTDLPADTALALDTLKVRTGRTKTSLINEALLLLFSKIRKEK